MNLYQRTIAVIVILINLNFSKSEYFNNNTKVLSVIKNHAENLDCIRVQLKNMDNFVFKLMLNIGVPLLISKRRFLCKNREEASSLCPNIIAQLNSIDELKYVLDSCATHKGVMFILFNKRIDWHKICLLGNYYWLTFRMYRIFYITTEHSKFYHPFIRSNGSYGAMVDTKKYNINKIFDNLYGYPMRVYLFDSVFSEVKAKKDTFKVTRVEGVDAKVAYLLENLFNFTLKLQWPDDDFFGARLENGSFNGALGRIILPVYMDKLCCYSIKSKRIPQSILPLHAVDESIWLVYLSVGLFSSFVWMILRRINISILRYKHQQVSFKKAYSSKSLRFQYMNIFTETWVLWVRMIIVRFPPYNAERIFTISLCLVSVIIGALLESSLATVYIRPRYYKDINSLEELEKANLKIFIKHAAIRDDFFRGQNSRLYNSLDERVMLVGEPEERLISIMSKRGGFVAVTREYSLLIGDIYYFITKKIHIIPECPKVYHIAYLFTKDSPYEETFNIALLQLLAGGLIEQWIAERRHEVLCQIHNFEDYIAESSYQWKAFDINDLQLSFYVIIMGNICAVLLFFIELVVYKKVFKKIKLIRK
ncbi:ionotropic receptor 100a isoform 2-T2 [Cochliomyia hominivorax]